MKKFTDNFTNNFTKKFMKKFMKKSMQKMHNPRSVWGGRRGGGGLIASTASETGFCMKKSIFLPKNVFLFFCYWDCPQPFISRVILSPKLIIFEGFKPNGLQIRIKRKIVFRICIYYISYFFMFFLKPGIRQSILQLLAPIYRCFQSTS